MIRVFIVARSAAEQEQLRSRAASTDIAVVGAVESLDAAGAAPADVIVFSDVDLLGDGASGAPARAIVWTDDEDAVKRVRRSALASWGVVGRAASRSQLQAAIVAVGNGLCVMSPETAGEGSRETAEEIDEDSDRLALDEPLPLEPRNRRRARHQRAHGEVPSRGHLREAGCLDAHRGRAARAAEGHYQDLSNEK